MDVFLTILGIIAHQAIMLGILAVMLYIQYRVIKWIIKKAITEHEKEKGSNNLN